MIRGRGIRPTQTNRHMITTVLEKMLFHEKRPAARDSFWLRIAPAPSTIAISSSVKPYNS
jgi:hypothetical protein